MVSSRATTVEQYLAELPGRSAGGRGARVREVILANLPDGFEETMQYGMIGYAIPLERFPKHLQRTGAGIGGAGGAEAPHFRLSARAVCQPRVDGLVCARRMRRQARS